MKRLFSLIILSLLLFPQAVFSTDTESLNAFEIPIDSVPPGGGGSGGGGGGLSGGAVTAIALGSVFGGLGLLGGAGYFFYKNNMALKQGIVCGQNSPYATVCLNDNSLLQKLKQTPDKNRHLIRGIENVVPVDCACSRFLILPDSLISNKTYNTVFFELPEFLNVSTLNFKITQVSNPYALKGKMPELDTKILLNPKGKDVKEAATAVFKNEPANGILVKKGQIKDFKDKVVSINTYYDSSSKSSSKQVYALIVEFSK